MPYFTRSRKMSQILFAVSAVFFVLSVVAFFFADLLNLGFHNNPEPAFLFTLCLLVFLMTLLLAIALRCVAKDAEEDLNLLRLSDKERGE